MTGDVDATGIKAGLSDTEQAQLEAIGFLPVPGQILMEQTVIGVAAESRSATEQLADLVRPEHFLRPAHGVIFAACVRLAEAGKPVDPSTVLLELSRTGELGRTGGGPYLHSCVQAARSEPRGEAGGGQYHARRIAQEFRRRNLNAAGMRVQQLTADPGFDHDEGFDRARKFIDDALTQPGSHEILDIGDIVAETIDDIDAGTPRGLATGYPSLDAGLTGMAPGEMIVVAARPAVGKSVAALGIGAENAIRRGLPVLYSSLEMSRKELMMRLLAAEASVPMHRLTGRCLEPRDWDRIAVAQKAIADCPLVIDDTADVGLAHFRSQLRRMSRTAPAALWIVDYLGLIHEPGRHENRQNEVAGLSRAIKLIAREYEIPVVAVHQLNRNPEHRIDKKPALADLRDSGAIEQDADKVILLHRDDVADRESPRAGEIDMFVAKHRNGPTFTATLAFQGHYQRISDMSPV